MCFFAAAWSSSVGTANLYASLFFIYNIVFGGLLLTASSGLIAWLMRFSFFFHAYVSFALARATSFLQVLLATSSQFWFGSQEILMVNEFHGYTTLSFNPSHSSLGGKAALISGDTWLVNVGMDM